MLPLFILIPLAGLLVLNLPLRGAERPLVWSFAMLVCLAQVGLMIGAPDAWLEAPSALTRFFNFNLALTNIGESSMHLGRVTMLAAGIVLAASLMVGLAMLDGRRQANFASLVLLSLIGMNGMTLVRDLFSMYVFLEVTSVASFVLIALNNDKPALEGAFKYVVLSAVATILMLGGVAMLLLVVGQTSFGAIHSELKSDNWVAKLAVASFVCGLMIKGGLVPFHGWVLGAYSAASAPVSVILAGIATKASGIYGLIQLTTAVFPPSSQLNQVLLLAGAVSIVFGALAAIGQKDLKRMLAYCSISQVGYIVLGLGTGSPLGLVGAIFHLFNHAIFKSQLFVTSSALEQRTGTTDMNKLGGLDSRMKITSLTGILAMLSTAGVPPLAGFWSKLLIIIALWQGQHYGYAFLAVLLSLLTLAYLLRMQRKIFFGKVSTEWAGVKEASPTLLLPAVALASITVGVGLLCPWLVDSFLIPIKSLF